MPPGAAVPSVAVGLMQKRGVNLLGHRSMQVDEQLVANAGLVLGMGREHLRYCVVAFPSAMERTFTLKEFVRRGRSTPRRDNESLEQWILRLGSGRSMSDFLGFSRDDDVDDPIGASRRKWRRIIEELEQLTEDTAALLTGNPHADSGPGK